MNRYFGWILLAIATTANAAPAFVSGFAPAGELPRYAKSNSGRTARLNPSIMNDATIELTLPDGRRLTAHQQRLAIDPGHARKSWTGYIDTPGSLLALSQARGVITGILAFGNEVWEITPRGAQHLIYRIDEDLVPPPAEPIGVTGDATSAVAAVTAAGSVEITLLAEYTTAVKTQYGQATAESMITNAVAAANQAYANSGLNLTLTLVGLREQTGAVESGDISTSVYALRDKTDGIWDDVHAARDAVAADVVQLISTDSGACGIAFTMRTLSASFESSAFSVVNVGCLSQQSLAHEIGHNMGNQHDRASSTNVGVYPYSYGYRICDLTDGTGFRTIMGYPCTNAPRVLYFSSPNIFYKGHPTGISYEVDPANSADNVRSMTITAPTVAAFRNGGGSGVRPNPPTNVNVQ